MTAKIRELNLDDVKTVAGGAKVMSSQLYTAAAVANVSDRPTGTTSWSSSYKLPIVR